MTDIFEQVKAANSIEDVITEAGFQLKGSGRYRRSSEHDSLVVDVRNQAYHWNSRGEDGDVIEFVRRWKKTDAKGAVEFLARRAGLPDPQWGGGDPRLRLATRAREDAFTVAARVYVRRLRQSQPVQDYLHGRGFTDETIKSAGLGFTGANTPTDIQELRTEFEANGVDPESPAAAVFIGYQGEVAKWCLSHDLDLPSDWVNKDHLKPLPRGGLVYPHVEGGRVRYVTLRAVPGQADQWFAERRAHNLPVVLAGNRRVYFNYIYTPSDDRCVIVEGQACAITLHQWGIPAVALAGVAAGDQVELLKTLRERHRELYIGLDSDEAGENALHPLGEALGPLVRLVRWSDHDANDWLQAMEREGVGHEDQVRLVEEQIGRARPYVLHLAHQAGKLMGAPRKDAVQKVMRLCTSMDVDDLSFFRPRLTKALSTNVRDFNAMLKAAQTKTKEERRTTDDREQIVETVGGYHDGWLIELTYDPESQSTALAYRDPLGNVGEASRLDIEGHRYVPQMPNQLMIQEVVLFPSQLGPKKSTKELVDMLVDFMTRFYDFKGDDFFLRLSAYYALFTWVYDCFQVLPYLRALGDYGTGKTQMIYRLGHVCYRLMKTSGASTLSPIFRIIHKYRGTLFLDEADFGKSDATIEIIKLLNTGYMKGVPLLRSKDTGGGNFDIDSFDVYCPKLIATRELFQDRAVESRCLTKEVMGGPVKRSIPRILKKTFYQEARELRNMLLTWRLYTWKPEIEIDDDDYDPKIEDRLNQVTMSLKKIVDDQEMKDDIQGFIRAYNQRLIFERSQTLEAKILEALVKIKTEEKPEEHKGEFYWDISIQHITEVTNTIIDEENRLEDEAAEERRQKTKKDLTPRGAGDRIRKKLNLVSERINAGPYKGRFGVVWDEERIQALRERYGV